MKLVTFTHGGRQAVGLVSPSTHLVYDLTSRLPAGTGMLELIDSWAELGPDLDQGLDAVPAVSLSEVTLCAPIPQPRRNIICVGKNYTDHAVEFSRSGFDEGHQRGEAETPVKPIVFTKAPSTVVGTDAIVDMHLDVSAQVDYEAELAVVIGMGGRGITAAEAYQHVWGYVALNDVTARDLQRDHKQWFLGKSLDTHCPMGPWIATADEVVVNDLELECRVNGDLRQKASVADLIFDIPTLIETISAGITLQPGDIIATGTPAGVGIGFTPPRFLVPGDVVDISITGLGSLRNEFR